VQFRIITKYSTRAQRVTFLEFHTLVSGIPLESRANGCHFCSTHTHSPLARQQNYHNTRIQRIRRVETKCRR
jgi:hypothetical protein